MFFIYSFFILLNIMRKMFILFDTSDLIFELFLLFEKEIILLKRNKNIIEKKQLMII